MISALASEGNAARLKPRAKSSEEEARSLVNFSRENLNISPSNIERGFRSKPRLRPTWSTILCVLGLLIALLCLGLQIWQLKSSLGNSCEIRKLKRDVEILKHRMLADDIMNALKALEVVLNVEPADSEDSSDMDDFDYKNYDMEDEDEEEKSAEDPANSENEPLIYGSKPSDFEGIQEPGETTTSGSGELLGDRSEFDEDVLGLLEEVESRHRHHEFPGKFARENYPKNYRGADNRHTMEEQKKRTSEEQRAVDGNRTIHKRATHEEEFSNSSFQRTESKGKLARNLNVESLDSFQNTDERSEMMEDEILSSHSDRHPPKKYQGRQRINGAQSSSVSSSQRNFSGQNGKSLEQTHRRTGRLNSLRTTEIAIAEGKRILESLQKGPPAAKDRRRGITRRHLRAPRQVYAVHYGADYTMMTEDDEHTGNGRARHNEGVFKAWRASDWVADLAMNKYFTLANDGRLTVHEPGLYLAYAQIHYLDEHDENGFHLLVNGSPVMQCMVYSPGVGHKSRSCFTAQLTFLQTGDRLVLKDVGPARYTLFQKEKSFFGLVKLGDSRQPRHPTQSQPPQ